MNIPRNAARALGRYFSSLLIVAIVALPAHAQQPTITPNYKDADLRQIVEAVGEVTGKNFLIDPRVDAKVTLLSSMPMSPEAFYEAFLSILEVHGYVAIPSEGLIKILPNASARQYPGFLSSAGAGPDDIVTQVIQVQNVGAAQLVPILRPLIPQYGHLAAHPGSNMLIISDRAANVARMLSIIRRIDQSNDEDIEVVPLSHASATEIVRVLTTLTQTPRTDGMPVTTSLVADPRTNSVLIGGDRSERLRLRALIAHLDTPLEDGGDTQVRYLRYADAEELSTKLSQHFTAQLSGSTAAQAAGNSQQVSVWADAQTNALVINAPPKMMRSLMQIVDKLDIRRAQVLVEAIIVEVSADRASELGVTWAVDGSGNNSAVGVTRFSGAGTNVVDLAGLIGSGTTADPTGLISEGFTTGVGRISTSGTSFAAILNALEGDADTNIISTPTIVTTDNEEASINVGQEVPFVTGSFSNSGGNTTGGINPFQTIQREQVGVKLTITPQINEGDAILLKISQEISSLSESATAGAADLITNERTIETTVIVEDGGILVLGGLIEDTLRENTQRVPVLGRIPLLGALFRNRSVQKVKTNLMVFIRPKILRDGSQTAIATGEKYNYIRDIQRGGRIPQMRGAERPVIPPLESLGESASSDEPKTDD